MPRKKTVKVTAPVPDAAPLDGASYPQTHTFAYRPGSEAMSCECGAEQDLRLVDGKAARFYRAAGGAWGRSIDVCPKHIAPTPGQYEPPDWRPAESIGEDHYASTGTAADRADAPDARTRQEIRADLARLNPHLADVLAPEIIDGCDVDEAAEDVDLEIACSPVLRRARAGIYPEGDERAAAMIPIEVSPLGDDKYRVFFEEGPRDVDAETVKVMRARYLLQRGALSKALYQIPEPRRSRWAKLYKITWLPPKGSPLHRQMMTGEPITIPNPGGKPVDFLAVMRALSTPGAAIPDVCPTLAEAAE